MQILCKNHGKVFQAHVVRFHHTGAKGLVHMRCGIILVLHGSFEQAGESDLDRLGETRSKRKQSSAPRPLLSLLLWSLCWQEEARKKAEEARKKAEEVRSTTHKGTVDNLPITLTFTRPLRQCLPLCKTLGLEIMLFCALAIMQYL